MMHEWNINDVVVGRHEIAISRLIPKDMIENHMDHVFRFGVIEEQQDFVMGGLLVTLRSYLLKGLHTEKRTFSILTPATWWDHLKHDFGQDTAKPWQRGIARILYPPKYRVESKEFEVSIRICPHNNYYLSEKPEQHISFLQWEDSNEPK